MVFCNIVQHQECYYESGVTILILIDGFLQWQKVTKKEDRDISHNPYFNRWFSAILKDFNLKNDEIVTILILIDGFLQQCIKICILSKKISHNPYFNRWFSAIVEGFHLNILMVTVTILILIDGFLQSVLPYSIGNDKIVTILI